MKRIGALILAVMLLLLAGCGAQTAKSADLAAVGDALKAQFDLSDMMALDETDLLELYGIDSADVKQFVAMIATSGTSSEEIVMIEVASDEAVLGVQEKLSDRFQAKLNETKDYLPDEYTIVSACSVQTAGHYIALIVSPDAKAMDKVYKDSFK